jgi:hypothetical protein
MSKKPTESNPSTADYSAAADPASGLQTANELAALLKSVPQSIGRSDATPAPPPPPPTPVPITPEGAAAIEEFRQISVALHTATKFTTAAGA